MSGRWNVVAALGLFVAMVVGGCGKGEPDAAPPTSGPAPAKRYTIAVIPMGTTHVFWKSVEAGAKKAGAELGADVIWKGPVKEDDRAQQIGVVDQFVAQGVDGIVLSPLDFKALVRPVRDARAKGIPTLLINSALEGKAGEDFVSYIATDNRKGGEMDGRKLGELLNGKGKVVVLRYLEGSTSTIEREEGFMEAVRKFPGIEITVSNRFGGATAGECQSAAMNLADKLREADGVFAPNEPSVFGLLQALRQLGLAGKVKFVGFDASAPLVDALRKGEIHALLAQDPGRMGYLGVKCLIRHLKGEKVEPAIDTGAKLITLENVDTPEIKMLLGL